MRRPDVRHEFVQRALNISEISRISRAQPQGDAPPGLLVRADRGLVPDLALLRSLWRPTASRFV
jgi:hypothetical protein